MKKTLDLLLILFFCILTYCCQNHQTQSRYQLVIQDYILSQSKHSIEYQPIDYQIIDNNFFNNNPLIENSMAYLEQTFNRELELSSQIPALVDTVKKIHALGNTLQFAQLSKKVQLHRQLEVDYHKLSKEKLHHLSLEDTLNKTNHELEALNSYLAHYNLSIYQTNLDHSDNLMVYHKFRLTDDTDTQTFEMLFEVNQEEDRILVEKILNQS